MVLCQLTGATLLSHDAHFLIGPDKADVDLVAVDNQSYSGIWVTP